MIQMTGAENMMIVLLFVAGIGAIVAFGTALYHVFNINIWED